LKQIEKKHFTYPGKIFPTYIRECFTSGPYYIIT